MKGTLGISAAMALFLGSPLADAATPRVGPASPFGEATVHFEQNATDGDVEVVFEVTGGADGLAWLTITGPDGRTMANFEAPDPSTVGVRQLRLESPEPPDPTVIKAAYPEGVYTFAGRTAAGDSLWSQATLSHRLPPPVTGLTPEDDAEDVPSTGLRVTWTPVVQAVGYTVIIEDEESGQAFTVTLEGGARGLTVPDGFLKAGTEYQLAIGTVAENGNASFVEQGFTTAAGN